MDPIEPNTREEKNALAFLDVLLRENGGELREVSYMTMQNVALLGMKMGQGKDAIATMSPAEKFDESNAYFFIQAAPGSVVSRALRAFRKALNAGTPREEAWETFLCEHAEPFLMAVSVEKKTT